MKPMSQVVQHKTVLSEHRFAVDAGADGEVWFSWTQHCSGTHSFLPPSVIRELAQAMLAAADAAEAPDEGAAK